MASIAAPDGGQPIVDSKGFMSTRMQIFAELLAALAPIRGEGSPEGVIEAREDRFYIDSTGTPGSILYVKRDADIGGDRKQGWILV